MSYGSYLFAFQFIYITVYIGQILSTKALEICINAYICIYAHLSMSEGQKNVKVAMCSSVAKCFINFYMSMYDRHNHFFNLYMNTVVQTETIAVATVVSSSSGTSK